jgi:hypothetical protein
VGLRAAGIMEYRGTVTLLDLPAPTLNALDQVMIQVYADGRWHLG